jgi:hypothetical protein
MQVCRFDPFTRDIQCAWNLEPVFSILTLTGPTNAERPLYSSLSLTKLTFPFPVSSPAPFFPRVFVLTTILSFSYAIASLYFLRVALYMVIRYCREICRDVR